MVHPTGQFPPVGQWRVTGQREDHQPGPDGRFVAGVLVSFITGHGDTGSIFVPREAYNPQHVHDLIHDYAQRMHSVRDIIGTMTSGG